jgi:transposase InsO family protein
MKYEFMEEHRDSFRLKSMCKVLKVSRSGYYAWKSRPWSNHQRVNMELLESIREVYRKSRKVYGSPRITDELNDHGIRCGKNRVARIMKENGIRAYVRKKFRKTTESRHSYPASPNLLINGTKNDRVWVSDITFIYTREGWMYVSAVMDVRTRKIIGLSMKERLSQDLTTDALMQAVKRERSTRGIIHHSDRGKQYASYVYKEILNQYGLQSSMSRRGNCYDNAYIESFWSTLKKELVYGEKYLTRIDARLSVFEYIEVFYNRFRKHSALAYKSPEQYGMLIKAT